MGIGPGPQQGPLVGGKPVCKKRTHAGGPGERTPRLSGEIFLLGGCIETGPGGGGALLAKQKKKCKKKTKKKNKKTDFGGFVFDFFVARGGEKKKRRSVGISGGKNGGTYFPVWGPPKFPGKIGGERRGRDRNHACSLKNKKGGVFPARTPKFLGALPPPLFHRGPPNKKQKNWGAELSWWRVPRGARRGKPGGGGKFTIFRIFFGFPIGAKVGGKNFFFFFFFFGGAGGPPGRWLQKKNFSPGRSFFARLEKTKLGFFGPFSTHPSFPLFFFGGGDHDFSFPGAISAALFCPPPGEKSSRGQKGWVFLSGGGDPGGKKKKKKKKKGGGGAGKFKGPNPLQFWGGTPGFFAGGVGKKRCFFCAGFWGIVGFQGGGGAPGPAGGRARGDFEKKKTFFSVFKFPPPSGGGGVGAPSNLIFSGAKTQLPRNNNGAKYQGFFSPHPQGGNFFRGGGRGGRDFVKKKNNPGGTGEGGGGSIFDFGLRVLFFFLPGGQGPKGRSKKKKAFFLSWVSPVSGRGKEIAHKKKRLFSAGGGKGGARSEEFFFPKVVVFEGGGIFLEKKKNFPGDPFTPTVRGLVGGDLASPPGLFFSSFFGGDL